ncbi:uncharacterized protein LODBEIA_P03280 [Lodderomyces beijingensis]|uniref:Nas2 N-terminal domain-containing protein n=1 Tax=Lodderomyces beijingensis TaxID=1775926 RepID=A0ABP0ZD28_9ASCO
MTVDDHDVSGFQGLMNSLNLDADQFKQYDPAKFSAFTFQQLSNLKLEIESQLRILFNLLQQKYNADMDTPLVTKDGFPRSDIDVVTIRLIRVQIIRLRNDYKELLKILDSKIEQEFARRQSEAPSADVEGSNAAGAEKRGYTIPFAQVKEVIPGSPASAAGLEEGDAMVLFDENIHALNHNKLQSLVERIKSRIGQDIEVQVQRLGRVETLVLRPTNDWEGQGLLGCRIIPI